MEFLRKQLKETTNSFNDTEIFRLAKLPYLNLSQKELNRPSYTLSAINSGVKDVRDYKQSFFLGLLEKIFQYYY